MFGKVKKALSGSDPKKDSTTDVTAELMPATIIPREQHNVSREDISDNALKVLYRLSNAGFDAYLVGGCVRDLMLGLKPKDFDVVTNATPEQIKGLFRNCRLVGRRFRLAHIMFGRDIIEVATFRGHHDEASETSANKNISRQGEEGQLLRDNVYGTIEEDAERRDFTVNAMYYNIADFSVHDFAQGKRAISRREIEMIGDPETRYREDPVRMLRAVRFAAKLDFHVTDRTAAKIPELANLLANIPAARMFEEVLKLFLNGKAVSTFEMMQQYHLFGELFPLVQPLLVNQEAKEYRFIHKVLANTDNRINSDLRVTPAFLFAAFLWYVVEERTQQHVFEGGFNHHDAFNLAINDVLLQQSARVSIPKRFSNVIRDIWLLQGRLSKRYGKRAYVSLEHSKFRAAYDFLLLRGEVEGGETAELAEWWTQFYDSEAHVRKRMLTELRGGNHVGKKRRRYRNKKNPS